MSTPEETKTKPGNAGGATRKPPSQSSKPSNSGGATGKPPSQSSKASNAGGATGKPPSQSSKPINADGATKKPANQSSKPSNAGGADGNGVPTNYMNPQDKLAELTANLRKMTLDPAMRAAFFSPESAWPTGITVVQSSTEDVDYIVIPAASDSEEEE